MDYEKIITLFARFYSREALRKSYEDEANRLEKFIEATGIIKNNKADLGAYRLNAQLRGFSGANNVNYDEFILLSAIFDPNTFRKDYQIFSQNREAFKLKISSDKAKIKQIIINRSGHKNRVKNYRYGIAVFIFFILFYRLWVGPELDKWFLEEWYLPDMVRGIIVQGFTVFLILVVFRVSLDYQAYKSLLHKIKLINQSM